MLCVVEPERLQSVLDVCAKWEVNATAIGVVTDTGSLNVLAGEQVVGDLPVPALVDECPSYDLAPTPPATPIYPAPARVLDDGGDPGETLLALLGSANLASRRPVFEQYDCIVGSRTARRPEQADAAVLLLGSDLAIAHQHARLQDLTPAADARRPRAPVPTMAWLPGRLRSLPRRRRGRARVLGQPRLRRSRAARPHQLPEFRQPREAAHRLAGEPRGRRPRRRLSRARRARGGRQRLALQRGRRRPDPSDAGRRDRRRAARRRACRPAWLRAARRRGRADRGERLGALARRAPSWPSCAARRPRASSPAADLGESCACACRDPPGRAFWGAALRPRRGRGRPRGRAGRVLHRRRAAPPR